MTRNCYNVSNLILGYLQQECYSIVIDRYGKEIWNDGNLNFTLNHTNNGLLYGQSKQINIIPAFSSTLSHLVGTGVLLRKDGFVIRFFGESQIYFSFPKNNPSYQIDEIVNETLAPYVISGIGSLTEKFTKASLGMHKVETIKGKKEVAILLELIPSFEDSGEYILLRFLEKDEKESIPLNSIDSKEDLQIIRRLQEEITSTKRDLADSLEHHVLTGEELQITNEELMSSNEELMASNEELKSVNEELQVVNQSNFQNQNLLKDELEVYNEVLTSVGASFFTFDSDHTLIDASSSFLSLVNLNRKDLGRDLKHFTAFSSFIEIVGLNSPSPINLKDFKKREIIINDHKFEMILKSDWGSERINLVIIFKR